MSSEDSLVEEVTAKQERRQRAAAAGEPDPGELAKMRREHAQLAYDTALKRKESVLKVHSQLSQLNSLTLFLLGR